MKDKTQKYKEGLKRQDATGALSDKERISLFRTNKANYDAKRKEELTSLGYAWNVVEYGQVNPAKKRKRK